MQVVAWQASGFGIVVAFRAAMAADCPSDVERAAAIDALATLRPAAREVREGFDACCKLDALDLDKEDAWMRFDIANATAFDFAATTWEWLRPRIEGHPEFRQGAFAELRTRMMKSVRAAGVTP